MDGRGFGVGNRGIEGIEKFLANHRCNPICISLGLPTLVTDAGLKMDGTLPAARTLAAAAAAAPIEVCVLAPPGCLKVDCVQSSSIAPRLQPCRPGTVAATRALGSCCVYGHRLTSCSRSLARMPCNPLRMTLARGLRRRSGTFRLTGAQPVAAATAARACPCQRARPQ